jgi:hypothetical protein
MKKLFLLIPVCSIISISSIQAQIGIAVAKDENGSSIYYQVVWNKGYNTESTAKEMLVNKGYKNIFTLTGGEGCGHKLTSGYYVVVEAVRKNYHTFGMGASSDSYEQAEARAVKNLSQYDWSWNKKDGYTNVKQGRF